MIMSLTRLAEITPNALPTYRESLMCANTVLPLFAINSELRAEHFLAQILHESGGLTVMTENLFYTTAERVKAVWPSRFPTLDSARPFLRNPEKLANKVYGNRPMDLGNDQLGDGWMYRGRGAIQITGKAMYRRIGETLEADFVARPELVTTAQYVLAVACHVWKIKGCNKLADVDDIRAVTKAINGGYNGLADRQLWLNKIRNKEVVFNG